MENSSHPRRRIVIQGVGGSTAYGTRSPESDIDRYAIYLADIKEVLGFTNHAKSFHQTEPEDFHLHELEKFLSLVLKGNPTIMELLWLDEYEVLTEVGQEILDCRHKLLGRLPLENAYIGYATQQIRRHGEPKRLETTEESRSRLKHLGHCYRLLLQAESFIATGTLTVRLTEDQIAQINEFRELDPLTLARRFDMKRDEISNLDSSLPDHPDHEWAEEFLIATRMGQILWGKT